MIDPEKLRRRMDEIWSALGREADAGGHAVMRACALTLITAVDEGSAAESVAETLAELMHEHPSRTIVIRVTPGDTDLLEADVETRCWMPFGSRQQICSEQIAIRCSEKTLGEVPGVIVPLVVADLPVVLWCASERVWRSATFAALSEPVERIILDSFRCSRPAAAMEAVASESRLSPSRLITDLSWTRLTRWRALLAQVFENEKYRRKILHVSQVSVNYEGQEEALPPTALLLAGWLVSRLGWQWEGVRKDRNMLQFQHPDGPARLCFRRQDADCRPGRLASFELVSPHHPATRISVARTGEACGEVRVEIQGREPVVSRVSLPRSTDLLLLGEELAIYKPDAVYQQSLEWAVRIQRTLRES